MPTVKCNKSSRFTVILKCQQEHQLCFSLCAKVAMLKICPTLPPPGHKSYFLFFWTDILSSHTCLKSGVARHSLRPPLSLQWRRWSPGPRVRWDRVLWAGIVLIVIRVKRPTASPLLSVWLPVSIWIRMPGSRFWSALDTFILDHVPGVLFMTLHGRFSWKLLWALKWLATLVRVSVVFIGVVSVCRFHVVALGNAVEFKSEKRGREENMIRT